MPNTLSYEELKARVRELERAESARERAEDALRGNEQFTQEVFDAIQDGISVRDNELNVILLDVCVGNRSAQRVLCTVRAV